MSASGLHRYRVLAFVALLGAACSNLGPPAPTGVILVSIDTLRPDHLGAYGYERDTSPVIDSLAADGIVFENAFAHAASTLPSHASIFTSLIPQHHGAFFAREQGLTAAAVTLAEVLREGGFRTASFNSGGQIGAPFGLDQGFEVHESLAHDAPFHDTVRRGIAWLERIGQEPFFLFLHTYEVHHPYTPSAELLGRFRPNVEEGFPADISLALLRDINEGRREIGRRELAHIVAAYDAEIRAVDAALGTLIDILRRMGRYDSTLIVLTSDHGEEFGEHGAVGWHSHTLYDELLRVPLILKPAGRRDRGERPDRLARSIDIAPTILHRLGLPTPPPFQGEPLIGVGAASREPQAVVAIKDGPEPMPEAIRLGTWKWIDGRLFDLATDPGETRDVAARFPEVASSLEQRLRAIVSERAPLSGESIELDEEALDRLRALGYLR